MDMHVRAVETGVGVGRPPPLFADQFTPYQSGGRGQIMPTTLLLPLRPWMLRARRKCTQQLLQQKSAALALDWLTYSLVGSNRRRYSKVNNLEKEAR